MDFVNNHELMTKVSYLDGYLGALATVNSDINQYSARVILLEATKESLNTKLDDFFEGNRSFKFNTEKAIDTKPLRVLEEALRKFILSGFGNSSKEKILKKKKYTSFYILDLIDFLELKGSFDFYIYKKNLIKKTMKFMHSFMRLM